MLRALQLFLEAEKIVRDASLADRILAASMRREIKRPSDGVLMPRCVCVLFLRAVGGGALGDQLWPAVMSQDLCKEEL